MLSYDDGLARILAAIPLPTRMESVALMEARGRVLARDIIAAADLPPFANSAVDGFAVRRTDTMRASASHPVSLAVAQTIAAGVAPTLPIAAGDAARILTGAMLPVGADAIVMVEDTSPAPPNGAGGDERVLLRDPGSDDYIRATGSDVREGSVALKAGTTVDPGAIGLLAALNCGVVACWERPRVGLIVTGDELVPLGPLPLTPGKIRNSNGPALAAAIEAAGATIAVLRHAADSPVSTRDALAACAADCDVILTSGGVSVGEYDYVKAAVEEMGTLDFWRIAIRPGKPLAFGKIGSAFFFGLPGNPVSSLVTFELFVRPALRKMAGQPRLTRRTVEATLTQPLEHTPGRREFVRATLEWQDNAFAATPTGAQGSHRWSSLHEADAYLVAHEDHGDYQSGDRLPALLLSS